MIEQITAKANYIFSQLDFGLSETAYRKALTSELREIFDCVQEEYTVPQIYISSEGKSIQVATLRIDIYIRSGEEDCVIELKTLSKPVTLESKEYKQLQRYNHIIGPRYKCVVNFHKTGVQILE